MYSPDINFLNDRLERRAQYQRQGSSAYGIGLTASPIVLGSVAAVGVLGVLGTIYGFLSWQNQQLLQQQAELDVQLNAVLQRLQSQSESSSKIEQQITAVEEETKALANILANVRAWSVILQDIGDLTPETVQLRSLVENNDQLMLSGIASSYGDANDFLLKLRQSPFIVSDSVELTTARLIDNPIQVRVEESLDGGTPTVGTLPRMVDYQIQATLKPPGFDLAQALREKGDVGLTSRIDALRSVRTTP